ncbi:hypothetical protein [Streptomyces sp. NBRC 109706]|uniref:hypothetical protein n=1 Tax=Streptomyces sp. NBRC 109706 TaxID=1550035 RepID=UPI000780472A|nr:hypothetical protein [Streptomyces sp. NBRC 109706]
MIGPIRSEPLFDWLKTRRRANELQLLCMTYSFDLDGALGAGQPELAWQVRNNFLAFAVELYLLERGNFGPRPADLAEQTCAVMHTLEHVDGRLADEVWELLTLPAPTDDEALRSEITAVRAFITDRLGVPAANRADSIQHWAEGVKVLREISGAMGLAQSDDWYLSDESDLSEGLSWYDEVLGLLEQHR